MPVVNTVKFIDLQVAFSKGLADFFKAPLYGVFFGGFYALGGNILLYTVFSLDMLWMAYPLVIGFALIGPFVAAGLYEISRRIEKGEAYSWPEILGVMWLQHRRELGWMAFVMLFIFWIWTYQIRTLVAVFFGSKGFASFNGFLEAVFTTSTGFTFLAVGHVVGLLISMVLFTLTVISCPLLLERNIDFVTAMLTSIKTVLRSPIVMLGWGAFVVAMVMISAVPLFLGLIVVFPVLGHATWHLYRAAISFETEDAA